MMLNKKPAVPKLEPMQLCGALGRMIIEGVRKAPKYTYIDENKKAFVLQSNKKFVFLNAARIVASTKLTSKNVDFECDFRVFCAIDNRFYNMTVTYSITQIEENILLSLIICAKITEIHFHYTFC